MKELPFSARPGAAATPENRADSLFIPISPENLSLAHHSRTHHKNLFRFQSVKVWAPKVKRRKFNRNHGGAA